MKQTQGSIFIKNFI